MGFQVSQKEVLQQSQQVFAQFGDLWKKNAIINRSLEQGNTNELMNSGVGKILLLCAMGESLEENIDVIRKYRDRFEIIANDKCFGPLYDHGVKADYVMLCDASIPYEKYMMPWKEVTRDVKLLSTPYGNPEWTKNWKGPRYFFVNRDSIFSERIFKDIFGPEVRTIPAGSNVSNAMLVFWLGCDNGQNINWGGYERYLLVGYDYSWRHGGNYYAWLDPRPKRFYMNHRTILTHHGDTVFTSENLLFSAKWLQSYLDFFDAPVYNCSGRGLVRFKDSNLEQQALKISTDPAVRERIQSLFSEAQRTLKTFQGAHAAFEKERGMTLCR